MPDLISPELRLAVLKEIMKLTEEKYVFPEVGKQIADQLKAKLERGGYDEITEANGLALTLTSDLRELSDDHHWSVIFDPEGTVPVIDPEKVKDEAQVALWVKVNRRRNFGFEKVQRLKGNIGYLDLRQFAPSEFAGEKAIAAMSFLAHCEALIFDLRKNHGGYPSMVQLITSYLVEPQPKHINSFYYRPTDDYQQFWTFPHVSGKRMVDTPVYVLISGETGSAPEEFAYNLKNMERATLIGETTLGAAHPVRLEVIQNHFKVRLPYGRPINPITNENWEGSGVEPHIHVPEEEALKTAHILALEELVKKNKDAKQKEELTWTLEIVRSEYSPVLVDLEVLKGYAGQYENRLFSIEDGVLTYMHQDHPVEWSLIPINERNFRLDEDLWFEFLVNDRGKVSGVVIRYADGRPEVRLTRSN
jgi:hypothetical protein